MPAYEQVATAAFRVIRMLGLKGLTVEAVANEMRRQKARPGSRRDLAPFVKFIRADYEKAAITPPSFSSRRSRLRRRYGNLP